MIALHRIHWCFFSPKKLLNVDVFKWHETNKKSIFALQSGALTQLAFRDFPSIFPNPIHPLIGLDESGFKKPKVCESG